MFYSFLGYVSRQQVKYICVLIVLILFVLLGWYILTGGLNQVDGVKAISKLTFGLMFKPIYQFNYLKECDPGQETRTLTNKLSRLWK